MHLYRKTEAETATETSSFKKWAMDRVQKMAIVLGKNSVHLHVQGFESPAAPGDHDSRYDGKHSKTARTFRGT
jgi:hypothetical protein